MPPWPSRSKLLAPRARSSLFDCFGSIAYKSGQEWNFWLIFTYFVQNFAPIAANVSDLKSIGSTKSYDRSTEPHFPASEERFPGPTRFIFLPGKLARSNFLDEFCIFFSGKPPDSIGALGSKIGPI